MNFSEFLNEVTTKSKNSLSLRELTDAIKENKFVKLRSGVLPYLTYKGYKSVYKKDGDFMSYVDDNIDQYKFHSSDGKENFINTVKEMLEDAKVLKAPELKAKYETQGEVIDEYDYCVLCFDSELTTTTGNLTLRWNIYEKESGEIFRLSSGRYAYSGAENAGYKVGDTLMLLHNDRIESLGRETITKIMHISDFKSDLKKREFNTIPPKMYKSVAGRNKITVYVLKTNVSPELYFTRGK